ncbi:MAG: hypothetical protein HYS77_17760 [Candidatus Rokubacteria bacterium]|nr:hypothetical protein [Candidatus Rokubacteria bacterium]
MLLARYPNVAVVESHLRRIYDAFGARRLLWGTDDTRLPVPYRDAVRHAREGMAFLSASDRAWVLGRACAEWVGWAL